MSAARYLIVNSDDFGLSPGVNRGIIKAHEHGIVTSASLMVRWLAARDAVEYARERTDFSLGLHVDLCEWVCTNDEWSKRYEVVPTDDPVAVEEEIDRQLETFRGLVGRDPTHLDSHQHVHREEPTHSVLLALSKRLSVPLRQFSEEIRYCGDFYGQTAKGYPYHEAIRVEALIGILRRLPPGVTELGCHAGEGDDYESSYRLEREQEVNRLCDPLLQQVIREENIKLCSFKKVFKPT